MPTFFIIHLSLIEMLTWEASASGKIEAEFSGIAKKSITHVVTIQHAESVARPDAARWMRRFT
jgi:hypothetical protein